MAFQIAFGRQPSESSEHTMYMLTALGRNRIKTLSGEGFGGGTDEIRILESLETEGAMPVSDIANRVHMGTGKLRGEISRLVKMGCIKIAGQGGE